MKLAAAIGILLCACQRDQVPNNRVLGDGVTLYSRLQRHGWLEPFFHISDDWRLLPEVEDTETYGCRVSGNRTLVNLELRGEPQRKLEGYREFYSGGAICSIRLGPGPIAAPLSIEWIIDAIDDPLLAARIKYAIGTIDLRSQFAISLNVDGVHVRYWQQAMGMHGTDPYVEFLLDGCRHLPDDTALRQDGAPLRFDSDTARGE